ncbi:hypothetical protein NE619_07045 [Anaerovorax odorimutans]|uniref:Uncharacterized protein n=1 Tax=Anaerovorax odorimutans TaxID=109327 RepID=A0ABT1RMT2_9FIRM|nr:hypothetical protein [Anaerovorax odorimutans]MCQ4636480.1 hypothetical protein [Anaerovorax odorimutans]
MKKDPLLSFYFDESSGNALVRYNEKADGRFSPADLAELAERSPDATRMQQGCSKELRMAAGLRPNSDFAGKSRDH